MTYIVPRRRFVSICLVAILLSLTMVARYATPQSDSSHRRSYKEQHSTKYVRRRVSPTSGDVFRVAIGGAISSKGVRRLNASTVTELPLFWVLLPSFCATASSGYEYHFYFGYDSDDRMADAEARRAIVDAFERRVGADCGRLERPPRIHLVECPYSGRPAWAQNDAMVAAYVDGMDFFYRLNDDTLLVTRNWTAIFVDALSEMAPAYVGAVGPYCERGPYVKILTHDFVHRSHLEIFGYYYPRLFSDWYADNWITHVYQKDVRALVLDNVIVNHTESMGKRYHVQNQGWTMELVTNETARKGQKLVERYVELFLEKRLSPSPAPDRKGSISMCLYGSDKRLTHGAIRNAQLARVLYPGWKLRVYYHPRPESAGPGATLYPRLYVPDNVIRTLMGLGAELVPVADGRMLRSPHAWRHLVFNDSLHDELVFITRADSLLPEKSSLLLF